MGKKESNNKQVKRANSAQESDPAIYTTVPGQRSDTAGDSSSPVKALKQGSDKKKGKRKERKDSDDDSAELQRKPSPVVAPLPQLSKEEYDFFEMVKSGDVEGVTSSLMSVEFLSMNINKTDKTGYTVLHWAVRRQDEAMVLLLLEQPGIRLYDTILHAIKEHNVEITKILLELYDRAAFIEENQHFTSSHLISAPSVSPISSQSSIKSSIKLKTMGSGIGPPQRVRTKSKLQTNIPVTSIYPHMDEADEDDEVPFDSEFSPVITPLMLAAQAGCIALMEIFYERNERLDSAEFSHNVGCKCDICTKLKGDQDMTRTYQRYHLFKALTQPDYICFMARKEKLDPVNYAIQKIIKVREIIQLDMAFNSMFEEFEKTLEEFMSKLLYLCRNTTETEIFLSPKDAEEKERLPHLYPRLWYTVGLKLKHFVAQPNAQNIVYKIWATDDWPDWDTYSWMHRCFNLVVRVLGFPLIAIVLLFAQDSNIGQTLGAPVSRFLSYIGSYIFFMGLVSYQALVPYQRCNDGWFTWEIRDDQCKERGPPRLKTELPILLYILSFYVSMLKRQSVSWYWSMRWNWFELITQLVFTTTFICWAWAWVWTELPENQELIMATDRLMWPHDCAEVFGECFLAISFLLAGGRMLRFLGVHPELGPIQIALGKQILDFISTSLIMLIVIFAFASGMMALYMPYKNFHGLDEEDHNREKAQEDAFQSVTNAFKTLFFYLYENGGPEATKLLIWNVKNESGVDEEIEHTYTHLTGVFLFMAYNTIGATMLFSMLSGYFASTFEEVMENVDVEWKFGRTELYLTFIKDTMLPPPFNLLPTLKGLRQTAKFMCLLGKKDDPKASCSCRQCCFITRSAKTEKWRKLMKGYRKLILQLLYRYRNLREDEKGEEDVAKDDILEIGEELAEIKAMLKKTKGENRHSKDDDNDDFPSGGGGTVNSVAGGKKGWSKPKYLMESAGPTYLKNTEGGDGTGGKGQTGDGGGEEIAGPNRTNDESGATQQLNAKKTPQSLANSSEPTNNAHPVSKVHSDKMSLAFLSRAPSRTFDFMDFSSVLQNVSMSNTKPTPKSTSHHQPDHNFISQNLRPGIEELLWGSKTTREGSSPKDIYNNTEMTMTDSSQANVSTFSSLEQSQSQNKVSLRGKFSQHSPQSKVPKLTDSQYFFS